MSRYAVRSVEAQRKRAAAVGYPWVLGGIAILAALTGLALQVELIDGEGRLGGDLYGALLAIHGASAVYSLVLPTLLPVLGAWLLPTSLGVDTLAWPRVSAASFWCWSAGAALVVADGMRGPYEWDATGRWPLSGAGVALASLAAVLAAVNFVATIIGARATRKEPLPPFAITLAWVCAAAPVVLALGVERLVAPGVVGPSPLGGVAESDPIRGSFALVVALGIGAACDAMTERPRLPWARGLAHGAIAALSLSSVAVTLGIASRYPAIAVVVVGIVWRSTVRGHVLRSATVTVWLLGLLSVLVASQSIDRIAGAEGADLHLHDTYFIVGQLHYAAAAALIAASLGVHASVHRSRARTPAPWLSTSGAVLTVLGIHTAFASQLALADQGMPRRYYAYPPDFEPLFQISGLGAAVLCVGLALTVVAWLRRR